LKSATSVNLDPPIGHMEVMDVARVETANNEDNLAVRASVARPHAFAILFDRHYDAIWRYICRRIGPTGADDLAGEAFLRAFTKRSEYVPSPLGVRPWLYGIATNLLREQARSRDRQMRAYARVAQPLVDPAIYEEVDGRLDALSLGPAVLAALSRLEVADRDALLLLALTELSYDGIAAATDVPVGTVRSRLNRARRLMRDELELHLEQQRSDCA
jgi:RNA polymerase sigma factor (sigma-70 family)